MRNAQIAIVGLSHLGLMTAYGIASKGFKVLGFDTDSSLISNLNSNKLPIVEPGLDQLIKECASNISFYSELDKLKDCEIVYIARDVPTSKDNESDQSVIVKLVEQILPYLSGSANMVIHSQVSPGFCKEIIRKIKAVNNTLNLFYQVETLIFGDAVNRVLKPERYIVGADDVSKDLPVVYSNLLASFACPVFKMRYESAELAKIAINMFLVSSVITASTLAEISEVVGADWSEIVPTLRLDKRIGQHAYLKPGLGIAGGNLERDLISIKKISQENGTEAGVVDAWLKHAKYRSEWVIRNLAKLVLSDNPQAKIAVWGLSYKADTHSVKNSASISLLEVYKNREFIAYDPVVKINKESLPKVVQADSAFSASKDADVLLIMTPWKEFSEISADKLANLMKGRIIFDPYAVLNQESYIKQNFSIHTLGKTL